jgi:hypothetical protein
MTSDLISAAVVASLAGLLLGTFVLIDRNKDIQRYYFRHDRFAHATLHVCQVVLFIAFASNASFVVRELVRRVVAT